MFDLRTDFRRVRKAVKRNNKRIAKTSAFKFIKASAIATYDREVKRAERSRNAGMFEPIDF